MKGFFRRLRPVAVLAALPLCASARTVGAWEGLYAMELRVGSIARVPVMGSQRSVTRSLLLVEMERRGGRLVQRQRVCDVAITSPRVRMTVPAAFVHALHPREYTAEVSGGYTADPGVDYVGYDPRVTGGALPSDARSPGVVDSDGDGEPGATVVGHFPLVGRVRLFVAQRAHVLLRGRQVSEGRVEGGVEVLLLEQRTLGASNRFFERTLPVRPDPGAGGFTLVRTQVAGCAELVKGARTIFAR
ncbi:MAG TPA: hypothetical protein VF613_16840 [Longimicrobium sp.]